MTGMILSILVFTSAALIVIGGAFLVIGLVKFIEWRIGK